MEWVVATAPTVEEAKQRALDVLGVDESEADFEIEEEPVAGLFGRTRGEARVRARVSPRIPPPKIDRRDRKSTRRAQGGRKKRASGRRSNKTQTDEPDPMPVHTSPVEPVAQSTDEPPEPAPSDDPAQSEAQSPAEPDKEVPVSDITLSEQADATAEFLRGLLDAFDVDGEVVQHEIDEDNVEVAVDGDDLGLLIGHRGQTLQAIGELARAASAQALSGRAPGRVHLDVAAYRQKRREALAGFTRRVAADVAESGKAKALEPMSAADRKVVHDTCNEIDSVTTISEGEEPRRRVVIEPAD